MINSGMKLEYINGHNQCLQKLNQIVELLQDMPNPDCEGLNWGHVGDINHIKSVLSQIVSE